MLGYISPVDGIKFLPGDNVRELDLLPLPPGMSQDEAEQKKVYALKLLFDLLPPALKKGSYLYVSTVEHIVSGDIVIFRDRDGRASLREIEITESEFIIKSFGAEKATTVVIPISEQPNIDKVILIR